MPGGAGVPNGRTIRVWADALAELPAPPFPVGPDALLVAYYASAELGCFLALEWPLPVRIIDLYAEFRCRTSGLPVPCGNGLLGALSYHGIDSIGAVEKDAMRGLAIRGGPFTKAERLALLDYCESDVAALAKLWPAMLPNLDVPRALLRGRFMTAAARMESCGVPIDAEALALIRQQWPAIQNRLIHEIDRDYHVYVPTGRRSDAGEVNAPLSFNAQRFAKWLARAASPGRGWNRAGWRWTTIRSGNKPRRILKLRRCGNCGTRCLICGWNHWPLEATAATVVC